MTDIIRNLPSKEIEEYWIYASPKVHLNHEQKYKKYKIGKWLIFKHFDYIDDIWNTVKNATENGLLGTSAKVSTLKPNPHSISNDIHVICVYTYNWMDINDVYRVEKVLREIGIAEDIYYKTDEDTINGKYKVNGDSGISKYISKGAKNYCDYGLEQLYNIGEDKLKTLKKLKIHNLNDLLLFDTSEKIDINGITNKRINKLKLNAISLIEKTILRLNPINFSNGEIIHFDIETDLYSTYKDKKIWSIAIYHNNKVKRFFAKKWDQEKQILLDFISYIKKIDNPHLYSYSGNGFDKSIILYALNRHELCDMYFTNCAHYDLCSIIKQNYILPIKSYGLKEVASYLGYKFKNVEMSGLEAALKYSYTQVPELDYKLPKKIFSYIDDDVKSMDYIMKQLTSRHDIKNIF